MIDLPYLSPAASVEAAAVDSVLVAIHTHILVLAAGWGALFIYILVRFRRRRSAPSPSSVSSVSSAASSATGPGYLWPGLAIAAVIAGDVVILATSALPAWSARMAAPPERGALQVRVVAEQFAWHVHYPGPDRSFGRTDPKLISSSNPLGIDRADGAAADDIGLSNILTVPLGLPTVVELSSRDVVHSFTLVDMRVRQDSTPGMTTRTWFTPTRPGRWDIACSQLCGLGHYRMRGTLTVLPLEAWEAWQATEVTRIAR